MQIPSLDMGSGGALGLLGEDAGRAARGRRDKKRIEDVYEFHEDLGKGAFGVVKKAKHLTTGVFYAVKIVDKAKCGTSGLSEVFSEVEIVSLLSHRYIIELKEVFETKDALYLVMELLLGGELQARLKKAGHFSETVARRYIRNILLALEYIHRMGIVHRDLKPANMLLAFDSDNSEVKVVDFGFAVLIGQDAVLRNFCGTPAFMAPEIMDGEPYGQPVDMWAVGVMLYQLLSGMYPFPGYTAEEIQDRIEEGFSIPEDGVWADISRDCKDMLRKLLIRSPNKRLTAIDALYHPWIRNAADDDDAELFPGADVLRANSRPHQRRAQRRFRMAVRVVLCCHRVLFLQRHRMLRKLGVETPVALKFSHLLQRAVDGREVDCSVVPVGNKGLPFLLEMVANSAHVDTLRLANNELNYDSIQGIVKLATAHPALAHLDLSNNPITMSGARALLRLARTNHRIKSITLRGCQLSNDLVTQINAALRENEIRKMRGDFMPIAGGPRLPHIGSPASSVTQRLAEDRRSLPVMPAVTRKGGMNVVQRLHKYP